MSTIKRKNMDYMLLLCRIFKDTADGEELLETWEQSTFYEPGINKNELDREIFIREGEKRFVRNILNNIKDWETLAPTLKPEDIIG